MKVILSRKGFDSGAGGCASPIFPDGSMLSLPIPFKNATYAMSDATSRNAWFKKGTVVADLSNLHSATTPVHLDPLLERYRPQASPGWRPAFGQDGAAQGHLRREQVTKGDLFLFFGWFREVESFQGTWRYKPASPDRHVLFEWLQIARILHLGNLSRNRKRGWLSDHPHIQQADALTSQNTLYVASRRLRVNGEAMGVGGGGTFETFRPELQLTAPNGRSRSDWRLPSWFHPTPEQAPTLSLSYHRRNLARWKLDDVDSSFTRLQSVARGQEFVIEVAGTRFEPAMTWLRSIFRG